VLLSVSVCLHESSTECALVQVVEKELICALIKAKKITHYWVAPIRLKWGRGSVQPKDFPTIVRENTMKPFN